MTPAVLVFLLVVAIFLGVYWVLVGRPESDTQARLWRRLQTADASSKSEAATIVAKPSRDERARLNLPLGTPHLTGPLARLIDQAGVETTPSKVLVTCAAAGVAGAVVMARISALPLVGIPVGLAAASIPILLLRRRSNRRAALFDEQFPEAIDLMARALRAGHALTTGLALVAEELPDPVATEFRLVYERQNFGMPLPDALRLLAARVPLIDARFFVTAVLTQRESGGNLAEILDNLASVIRQRFRVRRQIKVVTAHARLTGWVLVGMPIAIGIAMAIVAPSHLRILIQDPLGVQLMMGAVVLWILGYVIIRKLVTIEY
jgi:tight adherence protein B